MASEDTRPVVVRFRRDLRLGDDPALAEAARGGRPVAVLDEDDPGRLAVLGAGLSR